MTWSEVRRAHTNLRDTDRDAYQYLIAELNEDRWENVRRQWWAQTGGREWRTRARVWSEHVAGNDGSVGEIAQISAVRRTAVCLGGWEALVQWKGDKWSKQWVSVPHLQSGGKRIGGNLLRK